MADIHPPRVIADERTSLLVALQFQRESLVRKVSDVDESAARTSPVASGTSLHWLVRHCKFAEEVWIVRNYAGRTIEAFDESADRTMVEAIEAYRATWPVVDALVRGAASLDEPVAGGRSGVDVSLRWALMHLLEEIARHAGHADIIRELIDGSGGR